MVSKGPKKLKKIIKRMTRIQKMIASDPQPVSAMQLEELTQLGRKYAAIVDEMANS
jgi:hypothetical protein